MIDVFIGGFAGSKQQARRTADALAEYHERDRSDVEAFSFADAMEQLDYVRDAIEEKRIFTHSAGMLVVENTGIQELTAIAPPLPAYRLSLIGRAGVKSVQLALSTRGDGDRRLRVGQFYRQQTKEILEHPAANLRHLGAIASHDAMESATFLDGGGVSVRLGFMTNDAFKFAPSRDEVIQARMQGIGVSFLSGEHDELILYPQEVIGELDKKIPRNK